MLKDNSNNFFGKFKDRFLRFWRSENTKVALIRDILVALLFVVILFVALWAYTGQWFGTPIVSIESGSMQHEPPTHSEPPYGRIGTIDAGDMVLLLKVEDKNDIVTHGSDFKGAYSEKDPDKRFYGDYGDVIVYQAYNDERNDLIIHRAMCWVEVSESQDGNYTYSVPEYDIYDAPYIGGDDSYGQRKIRDDLGLNRYTTAHSGFITKGDHNLNCDQCQDNNFYSSDLPEDPVKVEWIKGKARGEIPWIGTINLFFNDITTNDNTVSNVPGDSFQCLVMLITILILIPIALDVYDYYKKKDEKQK